MIHGLHQPQLDLKQTSEMLCVAMSPHPSSLKRRKRKRTFRILRRARSCDLCGMRGKADIYVATSPLVITDTGTEWAERRYQLGLEAIFDEPGME